MNREIQNYEINQDLFFSTDHEWSEIACQAFEKLEAQPPLEAPPSVKLFVEELHSRLKLLQPILGSETEKFLGYSGEDVVAIVAFFEARQFNGMEAVRVQTILRKIWMHTPQGDMRLTREIYDSVDKEFYRIIDNAKKKITFENIPDPDLTETILPALKDIAQNLKAEEVDILERKDYQRLLEETWTHLRSDWLIRRKNYAESLSVDLGYLDNKAVQGTDFPSCSGLFANPRPVTDTSECSFLEFLNYWMPHFIEIKEEISSNFEANSLRKLTSNEYYYRCMAYCMRGLNIIKHDKKWTIFYTTYFTLLSWDEIKHISDPPAGWIFNLFQDVIKEMSDEPRPKLEEIFNGGAVNSSLLWKMFRDAFIKLTKGNYQPTNFCTKREVSVTNGKISVCTIEPLETFPQFVNSCKEYEEFNGQMMRNDFLIFGNFGEKIYLPCPRYANFYKQCEAIFLGEPISNFLIVLSSQLDQMVAYLTGIAKAFNQLAPSDGGIARYKENLTEFISIKQDEFGRNVEKLFDCLENSGLKPINILELLQAAQSRFGRILKPSSQEKLTKREKNFRIQHQTELPEDTRPSDSPFLAKVDAICQRDKFEREQQTLTLKAREAEVAAEERRKVLFEMSHSIKNLVASISEPLEILQKQLADSPQGRTIGNALAGTGLIRDLAMGVHMSLRGEVGAWRKDVLKPDFGAITLDTILLKALKHAISNMFDGKYFGRFARNYFARDLQTFMQAEAEWNSADTAQQAFACINRYFLDFTLDSHGADLKIPVGDQDGTATKLLILFQELLLNAIKYSSLVERSSRFLKIDISVTPEMWDVTISNSAVESRTTKSAGLGLSVINNFAKLFEAAYSPVFKDGVYSANLKFFLNK